MGYDISDYQDIHEAYGTLGDFEALSEACHARGLKLVCVELRYLALPFLPRCLSSASFILPVLRFAAPAEEGTLPR